MSEQRQSEITPKIQIMSLKSVDSETARMIQDYCNEERMDDLLKSKLHAHRTTCSYKQNGYNSTHEYATVSHPHSSPWIRMGQLSHVSIFSQTSLCSPLHSSIFSLRHSGHRPSETQSIAMIRWSVSSGRQSPLSSSAGWMTRGIHFSAKTSVHAIWPAVATVNKMGVKCPMSDSRSASHRAVRSGPSPGCVVIEVESCALGSCSCGCVATV